MILVDSHCHLDKVKVVDPFEDINQHIADTQSQGIDYLMNICIDKANWKAVIKIAEDNNNVFCAVGVHPESEDTATVTIAELSSVAQHQKAIAIGETGLDYFHKSIDPAIQQQSFRRHIQVAIAEQMPLVVHTRNARVDTLQILKEEKAEQIGGILHCFTESLAMAESALEMGFYISLSGILTFKNAKELHDVAKAVPLERLLIETDSPYLTPVPFRGKSNQPLFVKYVAQTLADIKECSVEEIAEVTTKNFFRLFNAPLKRKDLV